MLYRLSYSREGKIPRTDLLSQDPAVPVPSALARFTAVFGMGTGGSTPLRARGILVFCFSKGPRHRGAGDLGWGGYEGKKGQDLGRLGPVSSTPRGAYTPGPSTGYSSRVLTGFTPWEASSWGGFPA